MAARFSIGENYTVIEMEDGVHVTRPTIFGKVASHTIKSDYTSLEIAVWLTVRVNRGPQRLIQDEFPDMSPDDREFLMTGITPQAWKEMFGDGSDAHENAEDVKGTD